MVARCRPPFGKEELMRLLRSLVVVALCLTLGPAVASAKEWASPAAGREAIGMARIVDQIGAFFKAVWENEAGQIDPLGRFSPGTGAPDPGSPSTDEGWQIDPLG
jgi:hypothetical protein